MIILKSKDKNDLLRFRIKEGERNAHQEEENSIEENKERIKK
jgi:hypothetical protein